MNRFFRSLCHGNCYEAFLKPFITFLGYFTRVFHFYTPWKTRDFLAFSVVSHICIKKQAAIGMHYKKGISENFARFTIKYLYWRLCFDKRAAILLETLTQVFSVNFGKPLRTSFLQNTFGWLLLEKHFGYSFSSSKSASWNPKNKWVIWKYNRGMCLAIITNKTHLLTYSSE